MALNSTVEFSKSKSPYLRRWQGYQAISLLRILEMGKRSKKQTKTLSQGLSAGLSQCPIPSTHDKLMEAHFFIHEMLDSYHDPNPFRYKLSAFLHAAKSTLSMLRMEIQNRHDAKAWLNSQNTLLTNSAITTLQELRDSVVHLQALVPNSTATIGAFKYERLKMGFVGVPISPMEPSLSVLMYMRNRASHFGITAQRMFIGEDLGIERTWKLPETGDDELVSFCIEAWEKISKVVENAHTWLGAQFETAAECKHSVEELRTMREYMVFPEITKVWDLGYVTESVETRNGPLQLYEYPSREARILHEVNAGTGARGWVGAGTLWSQEFLSMIIESIGEEQIHENACVFFKRSAAKISSLEEPIEEPEDPLNS
jgi:hypothetical protein